MLSFLLFKSPMMVMALFHQSKAETSPWVIMSPSSYLLPPQSHEALCCLLPRRPYETSDCPPGVTSCYLLSLTLSFLQMLAVIHVGTFITRTHESWTVQS